MRGLLASFTHTVRDALPFLAVSFVMVTPHVLACRIGKLILLRCRQV